MLPTGLLANPLHPLKRTGPLRIRSPAHPNGIRKILYRSSWELWLRWKAGIGSGQMSGSACRSASLHLPLHCTQLLQVCCMQAAGNQTDVCRQPEHTTQAQG